MGFIRKRKTTIRADPLRTWEPLTEFGNWRTLLLLTDFFILLLVRRGTQSLPWESATQKVHEHVTQRFQIISTRLLPTQVRVD
jgi:hypothetical protein